MSTQSMTGIGHGKIEEESLQVMVEVKSVNHRFKDFRFKIPSKLSSLEIKMRRVIEENFKRGSFEIFINYEAIKSENETFDFIDTTKISAFVNLIHSSIQKEDPLSSVNFNLDPTHFLRPEFYKSKKSDSEEASKLLEESCMKAIQEALKSLEVSRSEEGDKLLEILKTHLDKYKLSFNIIQEKETTFRSCLEEKLEKKLIEITKNENIEIDRPRYLQEIIYYLEKMDIHEEMGRITTHINKLENILDTKPVEVGRNIEFLLQELGRETNTIGSKSNDNIVSENIVSMKMQLEKIREQALNLQ